MTPSPLPGTPEFEERWLKAASAVQQHKFHTFTCFTHGDNDSRPCRFGMAMPPKPSFLDGPGFHDLFDADGRSIPIKLEVGPQDALDPGPLGDVPPFVPLDQRPVIMDFAREPHEDVVVSYNKYVTGLLGCNTCLLPLVLGSTAMAIFRYMVKYFVKDTSGAGCAKTLLAATKQSCDNYGSRAADKGTESRKGQLFITRAAMQNVAAQEFSAQTCAAYVCNFPAEVKSCQFVFVSIKEAVEFVRGKMGVNTDETVQATKVVEGDTERIVERTTMLQHYLHRGPYLEDLSLYEYAALVSIVKEPAPEAKPRDPTVGRPSNLHVGFSEGHPEFLEKSQKLRSRPCIPMFQRIPPYRDGQGLGHKDTKECFLSLRLLLFPWNHLGTADREVWDNWEADLLHEFPRLLRQARLDSATCKRSEFVFGVANDIAKAQRPCHEFNRIVAEYRFSHAGRACDFFAGKAKETGVSARALDEATIQAAREPKPANKHDEEVTAYLEVLKEKIGTGIEKGDGSDVGPARENEASPFARHVPGQAQVAPRGLYDDELDCHATQLHGGFSHGRPVGSVELKLIDPPPAPEGLNSQQKTAYDALTAALRGGLNEDPKKLLILGSPGAGKSYMLRAWLSQCGRVDLLRAVKVCAFSGIAAQNIGGGDAATVHRTFGIHPIPNAKESPEKQVLYKRMMAETKLIIIDEVSMIGPAFLRRIDERLRVLKDEPKRFCGGCSVVFIGDFYQLEPVSDDNLYETPGDGGCKDWEKVALDQQMRARGDTAHAEFVKELRDPETCTEALRKFVEAVPKYDIYTPQALQRFTRDTVAIVMTNDERHAINSFLSEAFATAPRAQFPVSGENGRARTTIACSVGSPVVVTTNLSDLGVFNGTCGKFVSAIVQPKRGDPAQDFTALESQFSELGHKEVIDCAPVAVNISVVRPSGDVEVVTIPTVGGCIPLTLGHAMTVYKSQGKTITGPVVLVVGRPRAKLSHSALYVAATRVQSRSQLSLLGTQRGFEVQVSVPASLGPLLPTGPLALQALLSQPLETERASLHHRFF